jgi:hypothetical protein
MADKSDLRKILKPSEIELYRSIPEGEAPFGNRIKYVAACNAIRTCQELGDAWVPFSFDEYQLHSGRMYGRADKFILDQFVSQGLLETIGQNSNQRYVVTHALLVKTV